MNWILTWSAVAEQDLLSLPSWKLAARVDAALIALAENRSSEGQLEYISNTDSHRFRLRLRGGINVLLWVDIGASTIYVVRVLQGR